jgi:hypothetical protein
MMRNPAHAWTWCLALLFAGILAVPVVQADSIVFAGLNMTTNGEADLTGSGNLQLIPEYLGGCCVGQGGSAYVTAQYEISNGSPFSATFSYSMTNADSGHNEPYGMADGLAFVVQGAGVNALGGYVGYASMTPSVDVVLRTFVYNDIEIDQNGTIGTLNSPPSPSLAYQPLNLQGGQYDVTDTGTVTVSYDGNGALTVTGTDNEGDIINLSTSIDLSEFGGSAWIGFTGSSGAGSAEEEITSASIQTTQLGAVPEPSTALLAIPAMLALAAFWRRRAVGHAIRS